MSKLRFALVGCGRISHRHARVLQEADYGDLVAVCDIDPERARERGEQYGVPWYTSAEDMLAAEDIDVLNVLTPSGDHPQRVIALAPYGKHIVVEKPMALRLDDADAMIEACDAAGIKLFVVKQNRYNRPVALLRQALEEGRFGKLVMGTVRVRWCRTQEYYDQDAWRGTWDMDGGVLTNQASHHVDLLEWMMGDVDAVMGMSTTALVDIEAEDTAVAVLRFRNGALGVVEATTATRPTDLEGSLTVMGEKGTVEIGGFAVNQIKTWKFADARPEDEEIVAGGSVNPPNVYGFGHAEYLRNVADTIAGRARSLVDGLQGRRSLELINALYESIETREEVRLRFQPRRSKLGVVRPRVRSVEPAANVEPLRRKAS